MPIVPPCTSLRAPRHLTSQVPLGLLAEVVRHSGTNGWSSSWGTNAHGEIAGCPPPRS
jgi:hypothetical protein